MMKPLAYGMALTLFLQLMQSNIDLLIISDQLGLSALIFLYSIGYRNIGKKSYRYISTAKPHHTFRIFLLLTLILSSASDS